MLIGASRAHLRRPESPAPYVNTAASPTRQRARPKRPGSEPFVRVGGCAGPRHHERLGRGGGGVRRLGAARAGGGHDVVVPLAVSPVGGAGGRLVRHLWSVQLYHHPPSEHRGRRVDDHERLRPAAVRGALLLPVCGVCDRGGREGGPAALLAEGRLLLRDGRHPHRHEPHADHAAGQRHCLCHGGAVRTVCPGQEGRCHLLRPDPAAEAAGRRGEVGGDPRGGVVTATWTPSSPAWPGEEPLPDSRTWRLPLPPDQPAPRAPASSGPRDPRQNQAELWDGRPPSPTPAGWGWSS